MNVDEFKCCPKQWTVYMKGEEESAGRVDGHTCQG